VVLAGASLLTVSLLPTANAALNTVDAGWDLFTTDPTSTMFQGINFGGVPVNTYNFGGTIGSQNVGNADTIIQRTQNVTIPVSGTASTPLIVDVLQLKSTTMVDGQFEYLTLDPTDASTGTMTFNPNGTFTSSLNLFLDLRLGSLTGAVQGGAMEITLTGTDAWTHTAPKDATLINGVNNMLNGIDTSADFWPGISGPSIPFPVAPGWFQTESAPDSTSTLVLLSPVFGLFAFRRRRQKLGV
jgi:hypothetical protein